MIGILEFGMCNLRSVLSAVEHLGEDPVFIASAQDDLSELSHLIIPGVGSFARAMTQIRERGLEESILKIAEQKKPILGICLGMQLLAERGTEGGESKGLGLLPGHVEKISSGCNLPIPHIGWNDLDIKRSHPVLSRIKNSTDYYFVHSYHFVPKTPESIVATTHYGTDLVTVVAKDNIIGMQFHPEKSQVNGLKLLESFLEWKGHD